MDERSGLVEGFEENRTHLRAMAYRMLGRRLAKVRRNASNASPIVVLGHLLLRCFGHSLSTPSVR